MKKAAVILLAVLLALPVLALADHHRGGPGGGHGKGQCQHQGSGPGHGGDDMQMRKPGVKRLLMAQDELQLTDAQVEQLEGMLEEFQMERIDLEANLEKARVSLGALIRDEAGESQINAAIDRMAQARAGLMKMRYRHHTAAFDVLTPEQQEKVEEFRSQRRGAMRGELMERERTERRLNRRGN